MASFLCCLYFFPLIQFPLGVSLFFPHCLPSCWLVALCVSVSPGALHETGPSQLLFCCWVVPKSMMTKPRFSPVFQALLFCPRVQFFASWQLSLFFFFFLKKKISHKMPSSHAWEDSVALCWFYFKILCTSAACPWAALKWMIPRVGVGFQKGMEGLAMPMCEMSPSFWGRCYKKHRPNKWKETSSSFSSQTASGTGRKMG